MVLKQSRGFRYSRFPPAALILAGALFAASCGPAEGEKAGKAQEGEAPHFEKSPAIDHPDVAGQRIIKRDKLEPPRPAPEFELTNRTGERVSMKSLRGKTVMVSFIYTRCPEACPLLPGTYLRLQESFKEEVASGDLALVFITTDPENDTPKKLQTFTTGRGGKWYHLTGTEAELKPVWEQFGIYREVKERVKEIVIYHSYKTFLIDRDGNIRYVYTGIWTADDLMQDVREVLSQSSSN